MTNAELYGLLFYCGIALAFALGLVFVQGVFLSLESRFSSWTMSLVPFALCLGLAASTLLSGRNLKYASMDVRTIGSLEGAGGGSIMRVITAIILALCFAKIVSTLMSIRQVARERVGGLPLIVTLLLFVTSTHVLSAAFGTHPAFIHNSYYPILLFIAFFLARSEGTERALDALKGGLTLMMLGSLVAAVALPSMALQPDYPSWIPGFRVRLWGLGSNANSIGPLALLTGLLLYYRPYGRVWLSAAAWASLSLVFILSQSKTGWVAGLICVLVLLMYGRGRDEQGKVKLGFALGLLILTLALTITLAAVDLGRIADKIAASKAGSDISTLSGRATIWTEAWRTWLSNVWFGYGPDAWGPLHRARLGLPFAFHAHNQLLQSLSGAGLFGGVTMMAYLLCMLVGSWRAARYTRGVSVALAVVMLARWMTEAPLELEGLFIGETIIHLTWFMVVLVPFSKDAKAVAPRGSEQRPSVHPALGAAVS